MKRKRGQKLILKGFTLIELLAVIVILGIIMLVAIPAVTGYISNARNDSYKNSVSLLVNAVKNLAVSKNKLPRSNDQVYLFKATGPKGVNLESGGTESPYGYDWDEDYTYVAIARVDDEYFYAFAGNDENGNFIPLSTVDYINTSINVQNMGGKEEARKCIAGIAYQGNVVNNTNNCEDKDIKANWENGFSELKPVGINKPLVQFLFIKINGITDAEGKRKSLYVTRVFEDNTTEGIDIGYIEPTEP